MGGRCSKCEKKVFTGFGGENPEQNNNLQDVDVDGRAILNLSSWIKLRGIWGVRCGLD